MYRSLLADGHGMSDQRQDDDVLPAAALDSDADIVAASAASILAKADRAVSQIRAEAASAAAEVQGASAAPKGSSALEPGADDLRVEVEADRREDRAEVAKLSSDLESVRVELNPIRSGVIGLQNHSLRQTGVAALILAVLLAIAWKMIAG
jgi:hypothetical protein